MSGAVRCRAGPGEARRRRGAPWEVKEYISKKTDRTVDRLGNFTRQSDESIADPMGWTEESKRALKFDIIARDVGREVSELAKLAEVLERLVPDINVKTMKAEVLSKLLLGMDDVSMRLILLKEVFPYCNVSKLVSRNLFLLLDPDMSKVMQGCEEVRGILAAESFDEGEAKRLFDQSPEMIVPSLFKEAVSEVKRLFPGKQAKSVLLSNPDIALSVQNLEHQERGNYEL
eukprot:CAMPEP_0197490174 /NCGR_PEP_ID=MMETSP1311-20131121/4782_1 /TAXON_ID=464262 /ORGANISM="Genus nov. species nov., Strain RCC856" /LENGTH=229 /DNA_ID=CAMNT_0043034639 /DNA_START=23 /DNA_END=712 /DNA_ORIENTATION=+